ncbi:MAG: hypothetical protein WCY82_10470, partial [Desulfotomaculaceae bacterium]
ARLGILEDDLLICEPVYRVSCGDLVVTTGLELAYISRINNGDYEIFCPIKEQSYILYKDKLKAVIRQVIHCMPSLGKYYLIRDAYKS